MATTAAKTTTKKAPAKPRARKPAATSANGKSASGQILMLDRKKIVVRDGFNPRTKMEQEKLGELAMSLRSRGILTPVLVAPLPGGKYDLVAGHRRVAAADLGGITEIPAVVRDRATEIEDAVAENFNREDLTPLEEAYAFQRLITERGLTAKGVAEAVGVAQRRVTERLRILDTPKQLHDYFGTGQLSAQAAKPLAELAEFDEKIALAVGKQVVDHHPGSGVSDPAYLAAQLVNHSSTRAKLGHLAAVRLGGYGRARIDPKVLGALPKDLQEKVDKMHDARSRNYGGGYQIELKDSALDALRAAGVVYCPAGQDSYNKHALIKDPTVMREILSPQIAKDFAEFVKQDAAKREAKSNGADAAAKADEAAKEYTLSLEARGYNLRLGEVLFKNFATVELTPDVVRFLTYTPSLYEAAEGSTTGQAMQLFQAGLRYVDTRWQEEKHVKSTGRTKVIYASTKSGSVDVKAAFWGWFDVAKTAQEIAGRTVVAYAAAIFARQEAVPATQRVYRGYSNNHAILPAEAEKHLRAIVGKKIPAWDDPTLTPAEKLAADVPREYIDVLAAFAHDKVSIGATEDVMVQSIVDGWEETYVYTAAPATKKQIKEGIRHLHKQGILHGVLSAPGLSAVGVDVCEILDVPVAAAEKRRAKGTAAKKTEGGEGASEDAPDPARQGTHCPDCGEEYEQRDYHGNGSFCDCAVCGGCGRRKPVAAARDDKWLFFSMASPRCRTCSADVVYVRSTTDGADLTPALLCDDKPPVDRRVSKVIYLHSRTGAWVADERIVKPEDNPNVNERQLGILRWFAQGGALADVRGGPAWRKAFGCDEVDARVAIVYLMVKDLLGGTTDAPHITQRGGELLAAIAKASKAAA